MTLALSLNGLTSSEFWLGVGIEAAIYGILAVGVQLNVGTTGLLNFGQMGFAAFGAYTTGILVADHGWSLWVALPVAVGVGAASSVLVGLATVRLRADYFAITTIAVAEMVRLVATNADSLTHGTSGIYGFDLQWQDASATISSWLADAGWHADPQVPLLLVSWLVLAVLIVLFRWLTALPWGRVLRGIKEDEDAVRALGKNVFAYKLQSLALAGACAAIAGCLLAFSLTFVVPQEWVSIYTFFGYGIVILGGLGSYAAIAPAALIFMAVLEAPRFLSLPLDSDKIAALRFIVFGLLLMGIMMFRPQGLVGKREEMTLNR
jgi:branched-chain amino acid transport system permease protein